jgi:16S rRNA (guanine1207-N2)-methyltransferase
VTDHYFSADPSVPFAREPFTCQVWGHRLDLVSGSGVYSRGRLDKGTAVLLRETEPPAPGHVLDLGTGYGVIGLAIADAWRRDGVPAGATSGVTGVEVNQRAVLVVGKNLGGDSLQAWLTDQGYPTARLASAKGFRVLESRPG